MRALSRSGLGFVVVSLAVVSLAGCGRGSPTMMSTPDAGPPASGPALPVGPIGHEGRWLTDAEGRALLIHGVNMVNKSPPYTPSAGGFSDADAAWLADNGLRLVRVGVLATGLMPMPGMIDASYLADVAGTVELLAKHDVYTLIDFHQDGWGPVVGSDGFPSWMTLTGSATNNTSVGFPLYYEQNPALQQAFQSFWDDAIGPDGKTGLVESYAAMFGALAQQLAGNPHVLGYDLFNEPWPGTTWTGCLNDPGGCPDLDKSELAPAYAKAVTAIRAAGDEHLVFGEPFVTFNFGYAPTSIPLPGGDRNTGMSFHVYPLLQSEDPSVVAQAVAWAEATGGALLNTEYGATTDATILGQNIAALDDGLVPWTFWSFCCELVPSLSMPPGGANLVASTAGVLLQAYPLAVAGTPQAIARDTGARTLTFTWSTARPGGGTYATGAVTSLEVPASVYPEGYTATAKSGWITSAPCAPLLTVAAHPDASTVTVEVKPGGACK